MAKTAKRTKEQQRQVDARERETLIERARLRRLHRAQKEIAKLYGQIARDSVRLAEYRLALMRQIAEDEGFDIRLPEPLDAAQV